MTYGYSVTSLLTCWLLTVMTASCFDIEDVNHEIVRPVIQYGRQRRDTTQNKNGHLDKFSMTVETSNGTYNIDLEKNRHFISPHFTVKTFAKNGSETIDSPKITPDRHCHYRGKVRGHEKSMVSISTCDGISGMVVTNETFYIQPLDQHESHDQLVANRVSRDHIWLNGKDDPNEFKCGTGPEDIHNPVKDKASSTGPLDMILPESSQKRDKRAPDGRLGVNWPDLDGEKSKIVELYLVADYRQYKTYREKVTARAIETANHVSSLYSSLGVYVILVGMEIWNRGDKMTVATSSGKTLSNFRKYRVKHITPKFQNDNAQLITGQKFDEGIIGKASISTMCTSTYSSGVNMDNMWNTGAVATTMAHEMGHNFGMQHDGGRCHCRSRNCIMAATSSNVNPVEWSTCSKKSMETGMRKGIDHCLKNLPDKTYNGPTCGNGVVEDNEQCDCGPKIFCRSKCCDAATCRLSVNSTCATGPCCDRNTCKIRKGGHMCRETKSECDVPETCTGLSEWCPKDVHYYNGMECNKPKQTTGSDYPKYGGKLLSYCYKGMCRSHNLQCIKLWGYTGKMANLKCYEDYNTYGSGHGSCGYDWITDKYKKCAKQDVFCGSLMCEKKTRYLEFWKNMYLRTTFEGRSTTETGAHKCSGVVLDTGVHEQNPSFVLDGTGCGEKKMCMNHKCTPLIQLGFKRHSDCNGHGISTTTKTCYCDAGFAPPDCLKPGKGGSIDTGPPTPEPRKESGKSLVVVVGVTIGVLLMVILALMLALAIVCRKRPQTFNFAKNVPGVTTLQRRLSNRGNGGRGHPHTRNVSGPRLQETTLNQGAAMVDIQAEDGPPGYDVCPDGRKGSLPIYENVAFTGGRKMSRTFSNRRQRRLSSVCSDCGSIIVVDESGNLHPIAPRSPLSPVFVPPSPSRPKFPPTNIEALRAKYNDPDSQGTSKSKAEINLKPVTLQTANSDTKLKETYGKSEVKGSSQKPTSSNIAALRARLEGGNDQNVTAQVHGSPNKNTEITSSLNKETSQNVSAMKAQFNKLETSDSASSGMPHLKKKNRPKLPGKT